MSHIQQTGQYDELLMQGTERLDARGLVREQIERVLDIWRQT